MGAGALGAAWWVDRARRATALRSDPITGDWTELGAGAWWLLPNLTNARMVVPDRPHDIEEARDPARRGAMRRTRTFFVNSSARRLRGDTLGPTPPAGTTRIAAVGDSVTFGWGVADAESWPARLGVELTRRGHAVEVLNAGVPAQRLPVMAAWVRRFARELGVTGVLFTRRPYPTGGDPLADYATLLNQLQREVPEVAIQVLLPPVSRFDPHGCAVYRAEAEGLRARMSVPILDLTDTMRAAQGARGWAVQEAGGQLELVDLASGTVALREPTAAHGLPTSFYARLEADPAVREALFFDDGHPDADGIQALVPAIADAAEGLLKRG